MNWILTFIVLAVAIVALGWYVRRKSQATKSTSGAHFVTADVRKPGAPPLTVYSLVVAAQPQPIAIKDETEVDAYVDTSQESVNQTDQNHSLGSPPEIPIVTVEAPIVEIVIGHIPTDSFATDQFPATHEDNLNLLVKDQLQVQSVQIIELDQPTQTIEREERSIEKQELDSVTHATTAQSDAPQNIEYANTAPSAVTTLEDLLASSKDGPELLPVVTTDQSPVDPSTEGDSLIDGRDLRTQETPSTDNALASLDATTDAITPRYRAPSSSPPRGSASQRNQSPQKPSAPLERIFEVKVHVRVDRHGNFQFSLLLRRLANSPEKLEANINNHKLRLEAHGDDWYEAFDFPPLGKLLAEGFVADGHLVDDERGQWALSADRQFYVLAPQQGLRGFVSTARLQLGCPQIIICLPEWHDKVCSALTEACANTVTSNFNNQGLPEGWRIFGPLTPKRSVSSKEGEDLLNLLRPLSDAEIMLDGGLCLRGNEWLAEFPPSISLNGELLEGQQLLIDNIAASRGSDGMFTAPGWDTPGPHNVWCGGKSASYTISNPPSHWPEWNSHPRHHGSICGAMAKAENGNDQYCLVTVPMSNRVLLGANPGEIFICSHRPSSVWGGAVPFKPVWAIPADPLHSSKTVARVRLLQPLPAIIMTQIKTSQTKRNNVHRWCVALLDCRRKGLRVEPGNCGALWDDYVNEARRLWRRFR